MNIPDNIIIPIFIIGLIYVIYHITKMLNRIYYNYMDYLEEKRFVESFNLRNKKVKK